MQCEVLQDQGQGRTPCAPWLYPRSSRCCSEAGIRTGGLRLGVSCLGFGALDPLKLNPNSSNVVLLSNTGSYECELRLTGAQAIY